MKKIILLLASISLLTGCAILHPPQVNVDPHFATLEHEVFAIFPFSDKRSRGKNNFDFNVSDVITDAFETEFMKSGYTLVERTRLNKLVTEIEVSYEGNMDEDTLKKIGQMTNADVIILGMIRDFKKARYEQVKKEKKCVSCATLSYSVKAIHIETGKILWKGAITRNSGFKGDLFSACDCEGIRFCVRTSKTLVKKIIAKTEAALATKREERESLAALSE